jgi:hypothetical protein
MCVDDTSVIHIRLNPGEPETGTSSNTRLWVKQSNLYKTNYILFKSEQSRYDINIKVYIKGLAK